MRFSLKTAKLGAVLAIALGAAMPMFAATQASAAPYHENYRDGHSGDHRDNYRDGHRYDNHAYRGHWEFRGHRWQWVDGFWFGR
jgi:hypothetical protein